MTREGGKPLIENSDEVGWTAAAFDYYAEMGRNFAGRVIPSIESTQLSLVLKEPMGVVACIVPWNYPLLLLAWKVAPALAAGNTVVCKPSELTPLSTLALADCFEHFPPGVVNLLAGAGDVGERIVSDERVDCVAFTGSVETGKRIAAICAERVARVNLELGGKDPFIVCEDVAGQVEVAAKGGAWAAFLNAGQVCTSAERFYVLEPVFDDFASAFVDYTNSLKLGDPLDPDTDIGPLVSARQRDKVAAQVDAAVEAGAELLDRRERRRPGQGLLLRAGSRHRRPRGDRPAPRGDLRPGRAARARQRAWTRRSSSRTPRSFGLGCNMYTKDLDSIFRCMREIKAGTVWFNDPLTDNDAGPFGGMKQSGFGRELGQEGLEAFQETKHVHLETKIAPKEWWYPYGGGGERGRKRREARPRAAGNPGRRAPRERHEDASTTLSPWTTSRLESSPDSSSRSSARRAAARRRRCG